MHQWPLFLLVLLAASRALAETPLTNFAELRALPEEEAARQVPVRVEGTVVYSDPAEAGLILHDGTTSCYVGLPQPLGEKAGIWAGMRVRIEGVSNAASYIPNVTGASVKVLGPGQLPQARQIKGDELFASDLDSQWVEVPAVVVGVETGGTAFTLVVEIKGAIFKANIPLEADSARRAAAMMQRKVLLRGVVGTISNMHQQMTGRHFLVPSFNQIIPDKANVISGEVPLLRINELLKRNLGPETPVRVRGVVTQLSAGGLYLRDTSGSTPVNAAEAGHYPPGSSLEVEGYAAVEPFRPALRAVRVKLLETGTPPPPVVFNLRDNGLASFHDERVAINCEFLARSEGLRETRLQCRVRNLYFEAMLPPSRVPASNFLVGDQLQLTGICKVTTTRPMPRMIWADGFLLELAGPEAVVLVRRAPWWNLQRVLVAFGGGAAVFLVVLGWSWTLRRRVTAQAKIITRQIERSSVQDERQRIARELHDTVEQELTGISMQLDNASTVFERDQQQTGKYLALSQVMLRHCREEIRASVCDLRDQTLLEQGLPATLAEALAPALAMTRSEAALEMQVEGTPRRLTSTTEHHLLRIAKEAVSNAARHAQASTIQVGLTYSNDGMTLEIKDDGCGFDPLLPPPLEHFGLIGLHERANKIGAEVSLESGQGCGTSIRIYLNDRASVISNHPFPADP
ncbi:MAG: sensor histidine kinase [Akkermansiaceae bacterium]|nr:sensor histidine kinase [Akkermansiaceae bacterium]